ncbi:DNA-binding protein [Bacillus thuringiensis]|uniref:helix-turn-helix domain-containing protein n=1 Tax=Bacillus cereus group TaxID=86661 RepID=UPI000BFDB555|nr:MULTISPECIES: helix-turn-helix domain-containing protein [Bacillus cereus group]MED2614690.1 helix-turn-helix domain-containing protein [Bacillus toyonensis]PGL18320.1 DNA-binding protein [Bacillus thuringiensis]
MEFLTIKEVAKILSMNEKAIRSWFYKKNNPLEIVSNLTAKKKKGKWLIPKKAVNDFVEFKSNYLSTKEIAKLLHVSQLNIQQRITKKQFKCIFTIGNQKYVHKKEISPLIKQAFDPSNYYTVSFLIEYLNLDRSTIIDHIHRNAFPGAIKQQSTWYVPKDSVKVFKDKREKSSIISDIDNYYSLSQAAKILGLKNRRTFYKMLNNQHIDFPFVNYGPKKQIMILKEHIDSYQKFIKSIPEYYYTVEEVEKLLFLDKKQLQWLTTKWEGCIWVIYQEKYQKIIPKEAINNYLDSTDSYRVLKLEQPVDVFRHTVRSAFSSSPLDNTVSIMDEFFLGKIEFSQAHADVKRMLAREYGLFCKELLNLLDKDIMYCSDASLKMLFNNLSSGNYKVHFTQLLDYCQTTLGNCVFSNSYKVSSKSTSLGNDKEIYSLEEFTLCQKYVKNIEKHLLHALKDRRYASTWLFVSLHFTNAWRAKDFLALPFINIDLAGDFSFNWFKDGNRLNNTQAQKIINQYASQRLVVSKTGALNRFLVNFDMLIPFATMIITCDLHRKQENDSKLIHLGNKRGTIRKEFFIDYNFKFQSRKMNRSFMTHLFHKAVQSSEYKKIALSIPQKTRAHTKQESTSIYIQTTNQDEPIHNVTEHLFNRGHFGYLYNLLIQTIQIKKQDNLSLDEETFRLLELKRKFQFPLTLENFGHFLQKQQEKFEPIALQILNMPLDSLETKLETLYKDLSPSHTEHIQCFNYPDCIIPNCFSCVGCVYSVPKAYLLISIQEELSKRISLLQNTNLIAVAEREKSWILKLLSLLQEAVDTFGKEYVNSFINLNNLFQEIQLAFLHFEHYFIRN